jgi:hypothetical protein
MRTLALGLLAAASLVTSCGPHEDITGVVIGSQGDNPRAEDPYQRPSLNVAEATGQIWTVWVSPEEKAACEEVNSPYPDCLKKAKKR